MKRVLVIDNYDSFTYNLVHYLEDLNCEVVVKRNDKLTLEDVAAFDKILLSPGPGIPDEAGLLKAIIKEYAPTKSILGICLGQQAIGEVFGGTLINLEDVYHGVATNTKVVVDDEVLFKNMDKTIKVGRYHSLKLKEPFKINNFDITMRWLESKVAMAFENRKDNVYGFQFHPESFLTNNGNLLIKKILSA